MAHVRNAAHVRTVLPYRIHLRRTATVTRKEHFACKRTPGRAHLIRFQVQELLRRTRLYITAIKFRLAAIRHREKEFASFRIHGRTKRLLELRKERGFLATKRDGVKVWALLAEVHIHKALVALLPNWHHVDRGIARNLPTRKTIVIRNNDLLHAIDFRDVSKLCRCDTTFPEQAINDLVKERMHRLTHVIRLHGITFTEQQVLRFSSIQIAIELDFSVRKLGRIAGHVLAGALLAKKH